MSTARGPSFVRGLWRIAAADASGGNRAELIRDGPRTFESMIEMIDGASDFVSLESYIFMGDTVGERFADSLMAAARRACAGDRRLDRKPGDQPRLLEQDA